MAALKSMITKETLTRRRKTIHHGRSLMMQTQPPFIPTIVRRMSGCFVNDSTGLSVVLVLLAVSSLSLSSSSFAFVGAFQSLHLYSPAAVELLFGGAHRSSSSVISSSSSLPSSSALGLSTRARSSSHSSPFRILGDPFSIASDALAGGKKQAFQLSSTFISQLAVIALKARLKHQTHVRVDVQAPPIDLIGGRVGPVLVQGRDWQSRLGLTCRALEATIHSCQMDGARLLRDRKIVLTRPATGTARMALNAMDFGNFITHPRMPQPPSVDLDMEDVVMDTAGIVEAKKTVTEKIHFVREGTAIDVRSQSVLFYVDCDSGRYRCALQHNLSDRKPPQQQEHSSNCNNALVTVRSVMDDDYDVTKTMKKKQRDISRTLSGVLGRFFNEMVFELDGTFLTFRDLKVDSGDILMLSLGICVHKLPSRDLAF